MAHTKAAGSTRLGRDSNAQRLGVKLFGGQYAKSGSIILRQRGTKFRAGTNVKVSKDDTLFATKEGVVKFLKKKIKKFNGRLEYTQIVSVE